MDLSRSLALVPVLRSRIERVLVATLRKLPPPVQRQSRRAIAKLVARWPLLGELVSGLTPDGAARPVAEDGPPSSIVDVNERAARTKVLVAELRDPSAEVAAAAALALRRYESPEALTGLTAVVENADGYFSTTVRAAALRTLAALLPIGKGDVIAAAVGAMDADVSLAAIAALVERDDPKSVDALVTVIQNSSGFYLPITRRAAARGLVQLRVRGDRVAPLLAAETDPEVRAAIGPLAAIASA